MAEATEETVLGDFADASFTYDGVTSRFFRRGEGFVVRTDGPDGVLTDYQIDYVFGFTPLQQYLVPLPDGRYQALGIGWDSRPEEDGGQRWFHLYPGERVDHRDVLHWTKLSQSWDSQCAECHSTNLRKNYRWPEDRFGTTFSEIDVSCEACHGPGSRHVTWAKEAEPRGGARGRPRPGGAFRRAAPPQLEDGHGARHRHPEGSRGAPGRERDVRPVPRAPWPAHRGLPARPASRPDAPPGAARRGALLRRRADGGRGLQLGLLPPEQDVRRRHHLQPTATTPTRRR